MFVLREGCGTYLSNCVTSWTWTRNINEAKVFNNSCEALAYVTSTNSIKLYTTSLVRVRVIEKPMIYEELETI